jgi:hypothetical protein
VSWQKSDACHKESDQLLFFSKKTKTN